MGEALRRKRQAGERLNVQHVAIKTDETVALEAELAAEASATRKSGQKKPQGAKSGQKKCWPKSGQKKVRETAQATAKPANTQTSGSRKRKAASDEVENKAKPPAKKKRAVKNGKS